MRYVYAGTLVFGAAFWLVFVIVLAFVGFGDGTALAVALEAWVIVLAVVWVLALIDVIVAFRKRDLARLASGAMLVKLCSIPYFAVTVSQLGLTSLATSVVGFGFLLAPIAAAATFLVMLSTSVYGWATIILLRRSKQLDPGLAVLYAVMLVIFVADIVAGVMLYLHTRRILRAAAPASDLS